RRQHRRVPIRSRVLRAAATRRCLRPRGERDRCRTADGRRPEAVPAGGADRGLARRAAAGAGAVRGDCGRHGCAAMSLVLYDAPRCPYCARVRIVLAEKGVELDVVEIDLSDRPDWIYEKNSTGRVPVLEEDGRPLPESVVIMEFLEDRYPEPPL